MKIKPADQNPALPEFWEKRFREGMTPWDAGRVPARLAQFLAAEPVPGRVLIPGCGSGYEVRAFAEARWDVLAIDYAPAAVERAQAGLGPLAHRVIQADFFALAGDPYDLIYERAFLCALPRSLWKDYARRIPHLLRSGGRLAGFFFFCEEERGPPFGLKPGELEALLVENFARTTDEAVADSIAVFAGKERWQIWTRR